MDRTLRNFGAGLALAAATAVGAGTVLGAGPAGDVREVSAAPAAMPTPAAMVATEDTAAAGLSRAFRSAAREALPAVVHIRVESRRPAGGRVGASPFGGTPFEEFFRGQPQPQPEQRAPRLGSGSGFIFHEDGYVLTNNHVVEGATRVTVILQDKRELEATVVGRDPNTDVAVVKVDADDLPVLPLGNSDLLEVGDWVVALGYPLQLGATVTAGIVSAKGKSIGIIGRDGEASAPLEHFIQTDAAINPGNSGGPLVDLRGRVVGINSAIASPTGYYSGYGFAVPITLAHRVASDLIEYGEVRRPKLGIGIRDPSLADAEAAGLPRPLGALVASVEAGSPADQGGLRMNDAIVAVEGQAVESAGDLMELVARQEPGESVTLDVIRRGARLSLEVELDESFSPMVAAREPAPEADPSGVSRLGFAATRLTPSLAQRMGIRTTEGVVIMEVDPRSAAARAGVRAGMLIESVNGDEVQSVEDLGELAERLEAGKVISLVVGLPSEDGVSRTVLNFRVTG